MKGASCWAQWPGRVTTRHGGQWEAWTPGPLGLAWPLWSLQAWGAWTLGPVGRWATPVKDCRAFLFLLSRKGRKYLTGVCVWV